MANTKQPALQGRVLFLHGWRASPDVAELQMSLLSAALGAQVWTPTLGAPPTLKKQPQLTVMCPAGPRPVDEACDETIQEVFAAPFFEWVDHSPAPYEQWRLAIEHVMAVDKQFGPFSAVIGFSQGGAVAALCSGLAHLRKEGLLDTVPEGVQLAAEGEAPATFWPDYTPSWGLQVFVSGVTPSLPGVRDLLLAHPIQSDSLHVVGAQDKVKAESERLTECFAPGDGARVVTAHAGGHHFPAQTDEAFAVLVAGLRARCQGATAKGTVATAAGDVSEPRKTCSMC